MPYSVARNQRCTSGSCAGQTCVKHFCLLAAYIADVARRAGHPLRDQPAAGEGSGGQGHGRLAGGQGGVGGACPGNAGRGQALRVAITGASVPLPLPVVARLVATLLSSFSRLAAALCSNRLAATPPLRCGCTWPTRSCGHAWRRCRQVAAGGEGKQEHTCRLV